MLRPTSGDDKLISRILAIILTLTLLAGLGLIGFLIWSSLPPPSPAAPSVTFHSVETGATMTIAVDVHGQHVTRAELWSDNQLLAREMNPNPALSDSWTVAWQWTPPAAGVYTLAARVFDGTGQYGASSPLQVVVPPHEHLLFSSNRGSNTAASAQSGQSAQSQSGYTLYTVAADTRETALFDPAQSADRQPAVSSARTVAFAADRSGAWHILTRPLTVTKAVDLTPDLVSAQRPVWSADGRKLAFEVTISNTTDIFVSDALGHNRVQLTHGNGYDGQASFDPQGTRLAFAAQRGAQWDIYAVDLDGTNLARLTNDAAQDWQPAWSPDGSRIAFASNRSGISQIYVMPSPENGSPGASGNGQAVRLTNFPSGAEQPAWSPDGNWLAFVAYTGELPLQASDQGTGTTNRREIYLLYAPKDQAPVEGRGLIRLTQNAVDDTEPTWIGQ
jgi:Tol biopolymer transport system component